MHASAAQKACAMASEVFTCVWHTLLFAVPVEQSGADAAVTASSNSYKGSFRPGVVSVVATADSQVDAKQHKTGTGKPLELNLS